MATTTHQRTRKILPPATGGVKWVGKEVNGNPLLSIRTASEQDGKVYEVEEIFGGYRLHHVDPTTLEIRCYTIDQITDPNGWTCNCPDATNRPERRHTCKHCQALRAALSRLR